MSEQTNPSPTRPKMKGYGLPDQPPDVGRFPWSRISGLMANARNYWVASTRPDGRPHVMPVWGVWLDEMLIFSTGTSSRKAKNLAANPEIVVHLESGDDVVIFEGVVEKVVDEALLASYVDAYEAKYQFRPSTNNPDEVIYALRHRVAFAWLESAFLDSATRWVFEGS